MCNSIFTHARGNVFICRNCRALFEFTFELVAPTCGHSCLSERVQCPRQHPQHSSELAEGDVRPALPDLTSESEGEAERWDQSVGIPQSPNPPIQRQLSTKRRESIGCRQQCALLSFLQLVRVGEKEGRGGRASHGVCTGGQVEQPAGAESHCFASERHTQAHMPNRPRL